MGTNSRLCPVHDEFRVIVIVDAEQAYHQLAPPLLNRFEKQLLMKQDLLDGTLQHIVDKLFKWVSLFAGNVSSGTGNQYYRPAELFVGFNDDMLGSLVLKLNPLVSNFLKKESQNGDLKTEEETLAMFNNTLFHEAIQRLIWIATPEAIVRARNTLETNYEEMYFHEQVHSSLPELLFFLLSKDESLSSGISSLRSSSSNGLPICSLCDSGKQVSHRFVFNNDLMQTCDSCYKNALESNKGEELPDHIELSEENNTMETQEDDQDDDNSKNPSITENNDLITVMTYSPLASTEIENIVKETKVEIPIHCESLKLHEFTSARELTARIQNFYESTFDDSATFSCAMLIVQCDPAAASLKRISHAKYIMEKARINYTQSEEMSDNSSRTKKIGILLVHLNRESVALFSVDFESNWSFYTIDDIRPAEMSGVPVATSLLYGSEIVLLQKIALKSTLIRNFRSCLARLIYPFDRSSSDIQLQIEMILRLFNDPSFMEPLERKLFQLIGNAVDTDSSLLHSSSWQEALAHRPNEIAQAGSFREALFRRLSDTVNNIFTQLLCYLDRNSNLSLYGRPHGDNSLVEKNISSLW
eukprot:CAMPEP_0117019990 /NCGR_PEP_ID=MMETSP0472-20121206/15254_1 /TAXON_ID=693140 ORGANISM="Tiarina fusus, Strain LIS" /NCGR_SAMPLE_ID=MMETSP0472 /ASSEMBLY_ACC=CAM_ASM_000603 /LENGTH=585 /DNA_ID=CAMNT_0004725079 /DNA_START=210 /DNA_END=1964 /DNA_ORIENTATION=+